MLVDLFQGGMIVDLILVAIVVEACLLALAGRRFHWRLGMRDWLPNLLSGAAILVALRLMIAGVAWLWVAAALAFALFAHIADLRRRLRAI